MSAPGIISTLQQQFTLAMFNNSARNYFEPFVEKYFPQRSLISNKAKVVQIKHERMDVVSVTLQPNKQWNGFLPGQFVEIGVKINAVNYYRNFSISSSTAQFKKEQTITLTIQKQYNGKVTNWIFDHLKTGDIITLSAAKGEFVNTNTTKQALYIAGGSGITPFKSMLEQCIAEYKDAVLLYYAKSNQHIFKSELNYLAENKNIKIFFIDTEMEGRISATQLKKYCADFQYRQVFICGPNSMIADTKQLLTENEMDDTKIIFEYFKAVEYKTTVNFENNKSVLRLKNITVESKGNTTILEQLENNGMQPKYGCRMGLCKQCQCTKNKGIVFNKLTNKFSEATTENIQICVSIPIGEVEINL